MQGKVFHDAGTTVQQQVIAFARRGTVKVQIAGTGLTEQMFPDDTAQFH